MSDPRPSRAVKLFYSLGQTAQSGGFDAAIGFVFFYYAAVLGLSGGLVGAALAVSLAFDALKCLGRSSCRQIGFGGFVMLFEGCG